MTISAPMSAAYFETHFARLTAWDDWPAAFAIITAYATTGEKWTDAQNSIADKQLEESLLATRKWQRRLIGFSPATGHSEPGWAVELALDAACDLGLRYKQDAIFYVSGDLLSVSYCDHRRKLVPIGEFRERVSLHLVGGFTKR